MIITRIYTGADGQSHMFRSHEPGRFSDWHCESRRNYIITVSGEGEIGLGDGSVHKIGPGRVMLVEDLTGQGHTTRVTSTVPRVTVAIPLADETPTAKGSLI